MTSVISPTVVSGSTLRRDIRLVGWQVLYEQRAFWRNRGRGVFTFLFPLVMLIFFGSLNQGGTTSEHGFAVAYNAFFVPGILAYGIIAASFVNIGVGTAALNDRGVLKRMRGTPLPRWDYVAARITSTVIVVLAMTVISVAIGAIFYGVRLRSATLPGLVATLVLATAAFTTLGIGVNRFISGAEAAPVVLNMLTLPLTFISGVWFPVNGLPGWLRTIADIFPVKALADGLQRAFDPHIAGPGFSGGDLLNLVVWSAVGVWLMISFLRASDRD
jgi:ABC-2 type transport system permease protein